MRRKASAKGEAMKKPNLRLIYGAARNEIECKPLEGIPDYHPPIEQSLRSVCGQRFVVYLGAPVFFDEQALEAAKDHAAMLCARFIDARSTPWLVCSCGEVLMFVEDAAAVVM
jgi:hypothetical protein